MVQSIKSVAAQAIFLGCLALTIVGLLSSVKAQTESLSFAVIGDFGMDNEDEASVAEMVAGWNPELIITTGDNYYIESGGSGSARFDESVGAYYCDFLKDICTAGLRCPPPGGSIEINRFFPSVGNHDYHDLGADNSLPTVYTDYFTLPGEGFVSSSNNERYYDFVVGPVHFFAINSNVYPGQEPDGVTSTSIQAQWLQTQLAASTSAWNVVYFHSPPYSSGDVHGSCDWMQWPFAEWGADVVFSGDDHVYERIHLNGIIYFINGLGGGWRYDFLKPVEGSMFRYSANFGAQKVVADDTSITFEFFSIDNGGTLQDSITLVNDHHPTSTPTSTATATPTETATPTPTPTETPTLTPTETLTPTSTQTPTLTPTGTLTPTSTQTPTLTPTKTLTPTSTQTPTLTPTKTLTPTPSQTPTSTPTKTQKPTKTPTPTQTPTPSPSATPTQTITPSPSPSMTPTSTQDFGSRFFFPLIFHGGVWPSNVFK